MQPSYWRQLDIFNPDHFKTPVHIIGVGATGSWIALILAKMGVRGMTAWDHDIVEDHNLPNQAYGLEEVGYPKVEALKKILKRDCGVDITAKVEKVDGTQKLAGIVFICTDTMSSRKAIWDNSLKYKLDVCLVVETRLGAELGYIYTVRPLNPHDVREYEKTLYSDEEAEESPCTYRAISTVVSSIAALASHKLIKFAKADVIKPVVQVSERAAHESFGMFCIRPIIATSTGWAA